MRVAAYFFLLVFLAALTGCSSPAVSPPTEKTVGSDAPRPQAGPLPVRYGSVPSARYLRTACRSNNQSTYVRNVVEVTQDNNALSIFFPMNPAFHLTVEIQVKDGHYTLGLRRVPLQGGYRIEHAVEKVSLILDKRHYAVGDVLYGYLDLNFSESIFEERSPNAGSGANLGAEPCADPGAGHGEVATKPDTSSYYFTGPFSAIVRPAGFDPQADENIAAYTDLAMAMQAMPDAAGASELRFSPNGAYTEKPLREVEYWQEHLDISGPLFVEDDQSVSEASQPGPELDAKRKQLFAQQNNPNLVVWEVGWSIGPESFYGTNGSEFLTMWFARSGDRWQRIGYAKQPMEPPREN